MSSTKGRREAVVVELRLALSNNEFAINKSEFCKRLGYMGASSSPAWTWENKKSPAFEARLVKFLLREETMQTLATKEVTATSQMFPNFAKALQKLQSTKEAQARAKEMQDMEQLRKEREKAAEEKQKAEEAAQRQQEEKAKAIAKKEADAKEAADAARKAEEVEKLKRETERKLAVALEETKRKKEAQEAAQEEAAIKVKRSAKGKKESPAPGSMCPWCEEPGSLRGPIIYYHQLTWCVDCAVQAVLHAGPAYERHAESLQGDLAVEFEANVLTSLDLSNYVQLFFLDTGFVFLYEEPSALEALCVSEALEAAKQRSTDIETWHHVSLNLTGVDPQLRQALLMSESKLPMAMLIVRGRCRDDWQAGDATALVDWMSQAHTLLADDPALRDVPSLPDTDWNQWIQEVELLTDISFADIERGAMMGKGAYGEVHKGKLKLAFYNDRGFTPQNRPAGYDTLTLAVKDVVIHRDTQAECAAAQFRSVCRELTAYRDILVDCPTVVRVWGCALMSTVTGVHASIVMDKCVGSTRQLDKKKRLAPVDVVALIASVGLALSTFHASDCIHRDIKPANILYNLSGNTSAALPAYDFFVADFGIAKNFTTNPTPTPFPLSGANPVSSVDPLTIVPDGSHFMLESPSADVYAFGALLMRLAFRDEPWRWLFRGRSELSVFKKHAMIRAAYEKGELPYESPKNLVFPSSNSRYRSGEDTEPLKQIVIDALAKDRPTMTELLNNLFDLSFDRFKEFHVQFAKRVISSFVQSRVDRSDTPYPFHWKKRSALRDHSRMISLVENISTVLDRLAYKQLDIILRLLHERSYLHGLNEDRLARLARPNGSLRDRLALYLYVRKDFKRGYVGISKGTIQSRHNQHVRDTDTLFDQALIASTADEWHLIPLCIAVDENDYERNIATKLEPLFILVLNTYTVRSPQMGYNVEPGAKKTYRKYL